MWLKKVEFFDTGIYFWDHASHKSHGAYSV